MKKEIEVFKVQRMMPLKEAYDYIFSIHGNDATTSFDASCVEKYEVIMKECKVDKVLVSHNKIRVTLQSGGSFLWPILAYSEELNPEKSIELLKGLSCH